MLWIKRTDLQGRVLMCIDVSTSVYWCVPMCVLMCVRYWWEHWCVHWGVYWCVFWCELMCTDVCTDVCADVYRFIWMCVMSMLWIKRTDLHWWVLMCIDVWTSLYWGVCGCVYWCVLMCTDVCTDVCVLMSMLRWAHASWEENKSTVQFTSLAAIHAMSNLTKVGIKKTKKHSRLYNRFQARPFTITQAPVRVKTKQRA